MSGPFDPAPPTAPPPPARPPAPRRPPPPPPRGGSLLGVAFTLSVLLNLFFIIAGGLFLLVLVMVAAATPTDALALQEKFHSGKASAKDKVAVIRIEGVILEDLLGFVHKQIDNAGQDKNVKAVVLRIDSPGGSIGASDDLYRRLVDLRDGNADRKIDAKTHLVVSMGSMAASGGYYVSMPAQTLLAERTTVTGSIGVYAAFPNVAQLADQYGVKVNIVKDGEVKASGSLFKKMRPEERQLWQDMVDNAFVQFQHVVEEGRPKLKGKLREIIVDKEMTGKGEDEGKPETFHYVRRRADGGIFTADDALKYGLVDKIGYLDDAIKEAKLAAGLGEECKAVTYERPFSLQEMLSGVSSSQSRGSSLDPQRLASGAMPRLWYLAPGAELAGMLSAARSR
jgi:protease-4